MIICGGGAKSDLWMQIFADVYNKKIVVANVDQDAASLGATAIAARGAGFWKDYSPLDKLFEEQRNCFCPSRSTVNNTLLPSPTIFSDGYMTLRNLHIRMNEGQKSSWMEMRPMKVGFCTVNYSELPLKEVVEIGGGKRIRGSEIPAYTDNGQMDVDEMLHGNNAKKLKKQVEDAGLVISGISNHAGSPLVLGPHGKGPGRESARNPRRTDQIRYREHAQMCQTCQ